MGLMDDVKSKKKQKEAENWYSMGIKSPDPEKKLDYFTRSLELDPNNISAWVKKGRILEDMGKFDEAKRSYDRATLLDPSLDIRIKRTNSFTENERISTPEYIPKQPEYAQEETQYVKEEEQYLAMDSPAETDYYEAEETEEVASFIPPQGEESIFSNIKEKESGVADEEKENIMDIETAKSSGEINFAPPDQEIVPDNDLPKQNISEIANETVVATSSSEQKKDDVIKSERTPTFDKRPASNNASVIGNEKKKVQSETTKISSYVQMEGKNANLRIPLLETIKFWLIGAIVFYLITRLI